MARVSGFRKVSIPSSSTFPISIPSSSTFPNKETVADELDSGRHVVFGEVVSGMDVMKSVEKVGRKEDGKVSDSKKVTVKDCGPV